MHILLYHYSYVTYIFFPPFTIAARRRFLQRHVNGFAIYANVIESLSSAGRTVDLWPCTLSA